MAKALGPAVFRELLKNTFFFVHFTWENCQSLRMWGSMVKTVLLFSVGLYKP